MKKKMKNNKGFTLVELIVVIAIIGILVAIAVPRFSSSLDKAKEAADEATAKAIQTAVGMYALDNNGTFPADGTVVSVMVGDGGVLYNYLGDVEAQSGDMDTVFQYANGVVEFYN